MKIPGIAATSVMILCLGLQAEIVGQPAADLGDNPVTAAPASDIVPQPGQRSYLEGFSDPLEDWNQGWFYLHTNAENFYVADGADCAPNFRGNQPLGIWISDDRGCGGIAVQSPVTIKFLNHFADQAVLFALDQFTCVNGVTFQIYDKDGALVVSEPLPASCFAFNHYRYVLSNGISSFEYAYTGDQEVPDYLSFGVEGNTSVDNVTLVVEEKAGP